jgi:aminopeptidase N
MSRVSPRPVPRSLPSLAVAALLWGTVTAPAQVVAGHRLPEGPERPVRERTIDVQRLGVDLRLDLDGDTVAGHVDVDFTPLRTGLREVRLDAADLRVTRVALTAGGKAEADVPFETVGRELVARLPAPLDPGADASLRVEYSARPRCGLYFFPASSRASAEVWNYGEGGLHYAWLPLYNDTNDRFSVEMLLTVKKPDVALSNGRLVDTRENPDGTRTFHWVQEEPIPNYLLALDAGDLERVDLGEAASGARAVPVGVWGPPGAGDALAYTFRNTPRMVELFTRLFGRPYAWPKYDQIVLHEFEGAMETTGLVGFTEDYVRKEGDPPDSDPQLELAWPIWTTEDTIAHELAHHWFGDLVTCRSLGSLWLNESFASFSHTLWTEHDRGEDDLTYQRWRYLNAYLDYVRKSGTVRPLEYHRYQAPEDMYQEETTYLKGALVLHMLRRVVGEADFQRALALYLDRHAFGNVEASDLLAAIEDATGRNVDWFFRDWIVGGGGHPVFDVAWSWSAERHEVDLTVKQVQADLPFENDFRLPLDVEVVTPGGRTTHRVEIVGWTTSVRLPAPERPITVTFDKGGWAVAEVRFPRTLAELRAQLEGGGLAEQLRAARQLAVDHASAPEAVAELARDLASTSAHWGLRQEAALDLGRMHAPGTVEPLVAAAGDADRRVRRAAAVALADVGGPRAAATLRRLVESDPAEDVAGAAAFSLGRMGGPDAAAFLKRQLARDSHWWDVIRLGALLGLGQVADPGLAPELSRFTDERWPRPVRVAALQGWLRAAPDDPALGPRLRELARDRNRSVRQAALQALGQRHRAEDREFLETYAREEPDPSLARDARAAADAVAAFTGQ